MMVLGSIIGGLFFLGLFVVINVVGLVILIFYILGGILVYFIFYVLLEMIVVNLDLGFFMIFLV